MYTSVLSLCLLLAPLANTTPLWQPSYDVAVDLGQKYGKPVAVFVGTGAKGVSQLVTEGQLSEEALRLMAQNYVCVYLDQTNGGQGLVRQLGISQGMGLVIGDRSGSYQAFHHDGRLSGAELTQRLRQFADPQLVVTRTVSNTAQRTSYYSDPAPRSYSPAIRVNC
jgi:hypothetical protein